LLGNFKDFEDLVFRQMLLRRLRVDEKIVVHYKIRAFKLMEKERPKNGCFCTGMDVSFSD